MTDPYEVKEIEEFEDEMEKNLTIRETAMMDSGNQSDGWVELECLFDSVE